MNTLPCFKIFPFTIIEKYINRIHPEYQKARSVERYEHDLPAHNMMMMILTWQRTSADPHWDLCWEQREPLHPWLPHRLYIYSHTMALHKHGFLEGRPLQVCCNKQNIKCIIMTYVFFYFLWSLTIKVQSKWLFPSVRHMILALIYLKTKRWCG